MTSFRTAFVFISALTHVSATTCVSDFLDDTTSSGHACIIKREVESVCCPRSGTFLCRVLGYVGIGFLALTSGATPASEVATAALSENDSSMVPESTGLGKRFISLGLPVASAMKIPQDPLQKEDRENVMWTGAPETHEDTEESSTGNKVVPKDETETVAMYRKAADHGDADAQYNLGLIYHLGTCVTKDDSKAFAWFRKAADQGGAEAQHSLGVMYDNGHGVARDYTKALSWYRKAAHQGNAKAQTLLGISYFRGRGVAKDLSEAFLWLRKAAHQGEESALLTLLILNESSEEL